MGKKRSFKLPDGRTADIDEDKVQALLEIEPDAKEVASFIVGKDTVDVPVENADKYLQIEPDAKPLFEDEEVKKKGSASSGSGVPTDGERNPYAPNTEIDFSSLQDKKSPVNPILVDDKNNATDSPFVQSLKPKENVVKKLQDNVAKAAEKERIAAEKERKASVLVNQFKKEPTPKGYKPDDVGMETYAEASKAHMADQNADIEKFIQPEVQKLQQQYTSLRESDAKYQEAMAPIKQQIDAYSQELTAKAQKIVIDNHITDPAKLQEMNGELNKAVNEYAKKLEDASPELKERNDFYNKAISDDLDVFIKNNYKPKTKYFGNGEPIEPFISAIKSESFGILSQNEKKTIIASMWDKLNTRMAQKGIPQNTINEAKQEFMWYAMDAATHNENGGISQFALREMATKMKSALEEEYKNTEADRKLLYEHTKDLVNANSMSKEDRAIYDKTTKIENSIKNIDALLSTPDGDINKWLAFGKGFASEAGLPFIKSLNEISTGIDTYKISQKILKKQPLTPEEATYMKTVGMADAIRAEMPKNAAYNVGAGLAGSMVFLGEFAALNPVGAIVEEGSANALRLGLKGAGNKIKQAAYKEAIATQLAQAPIKFTKPLLYEALVVKPLSTLIGATAQTLASPNQVINNTIKRLTPQALVMFSPEVNDLVTELNTQKFNIEGYRTGHNEPMSEALPRGFAQAFTEIFTEKMFTGLSGVSDLATKGLMTRLAKDIPTAQKMFVSYMMSKYKLRVDQVDDFLKNSGLPVGGFIEEFGEEVGSGALQPWLTGDGRPLGDWYDPEKGFNLRTIGETAGVIAGQNLLFRGLGAAATMGKGGYIDLRVHDGQTAFNAPISQKGFDFIGSSLKGKDNEYIKAWAATHITSFNKKEQLAAKAIINHLAKERIFQTHNGEIVPDVYGVNQQAPPTPGQTPPPNTPPPPPPTPEQQAAEDFDIKERNRGNTGYTIQHQDGTIETPDDKELLEWLAVPANLRALEQGQSTLSADNPSDEVSAVLVEFAKHGSAIATPDGAITAEKHNGKYVKYKGELGIIHVDEGGKITVETPDKIYDIQGNVTDDLTEHGIEPINARPAGSATQAPPSPASPAGPTAESESDEAITTDAERLRGTAAGEVLAAEFANEQDPYDAASRAYHEALRIPIGKRSKLQHKLISQVEDAFSEKDKAPDPPSDKIEPNIIANDNSGNKGTPNDGDSKDNEEEQGKLDGVPNKKEEANPKGEAKQNAKKKDDGVAKKESEGVSGSALKDVGKGEPLNTNEEAKLKELYKKSFLKQEMTPQEQQEFVDLKNKKNEFKRKQALDNQLEEGANVNGDWVSIHSGGYKKMGLFYRGENWEVNIQNRLNNNILTIRKRNPKTGELEIIHQSDHKTEQGAIEEYKKHNKGIEDEINARFDDQVEKPQAPTQYTEAATPAKKESEGVSGSALKDVDLGGGIKNKATDEGVNLLPISEIDNLRSQKQTDLATGNAVEMEKDLSKNGIKEPLVITYYPNEGKAVLTDGHNRLDVAKDMGAEKLPIRIVERYTDAPNNAKDWTPPQATTQYTEAAPPTEEDVEDDNNAQDDDILNEAEDRRKKGKFTYLGNEYVRQAKDTESPKGKTGMVRFTNEPGGGGIVVPFKYKLVEASTLQASHNAGIPNPMHFIPEAQPKSRNDAGSKAAEDNFAERPRGPELGEKADAFGGAPVVNTRNEVIQGNNRSAGLKKGAANNTQGSREYKQWLSDNAADFGFTPEQVAEMKNPILVREVDTTDEGAIELGNYDVKDLETGGKRRVDPVAISRRISPAKKQRIVEIVLTSDETLNAQIRKNIKQLWPILSPFLNQSHRDTMMRDGELTEPGAKDIEAIIQQFLFDNAPAGMADLFDQLPASAQSAILKSLPSIINKNSRLGLVKDVQNAMIALNEFLASQVDNIGEWVNQLSMFGDGKKPSEVYTPLEIAIATLMDKIGSKVNGQPFTMTKLVNIFKEYAELVNGKEGDLMNPEGTAAIPKKEAVKQIFNVEYNDRKSDRNIEADKGEPNQEKDDKGEADKPKPPAQEKRKQEGLITPAQQMADAKAELARAWKASGYAFNKNAGQNMGFMYDPAVDIKRQDDLFKALFKVAKLAIQQAANKLLAINASDFIASIRGYGKLYADITDAHLTDVFNEAKKAFDAKEKDQSLVDPQMSQRTPNSAALAHDLVERVKTIYAKFGVPIAEQKLKKVRGFFQTHPEIVKISSMFNVAVGAHELMHYIIKKNGMVAKVLSGSTVVSNQLKDIYINHYPGAKDTHAEELQIEEGMTMLVNLWVQNPAYAQQMYGDAYYAMFDPAGSLYNNDVHDMALDFAEIIEDFLGLPANERIGARIRWGQPGVKKRTLHHNAYNAIKYQIYDKLYLAKDVDRMLGNEFKGSGIAPNIAMMRTAKTRMQHWFVRSKLANTRPQTPGKDGNWKEARYNTTVSDYMDLFHDKESGLTIEEFNQMLVARRQLSDYKRIDKIDADVAAAKKMIETLEIDNKALEAQIAVETDKAILQSLKVQLSANLQNIDNHIANISELIEEANKISDILERNRMSRPFAEEVISLLGQKYAEPARLFDEVQANIVDMMEATGMVSAERANEWRGKDGYASFRRYFDNEEKLRESLVDAVGSKGVKQLTSLFPYKGSDLPLLPATYSQALAINEVMMKGSRNMMWQAWAMAAANNKDVARMFRQRTSSETDKTDNIVVWMDGEKHIYQASAEVILFANAIENIQPDKFEEVGKAIAKMLQVSVTGIYLPFALVNLSVDAATRFQLSETGAIPVVHDFRTIYHMLESPVKKLVGQMLGKEFDPNIIDQYISMGGKASLNINLINISAEGVMKQFLAPSALDKAKLAADMSVEALSLAVNLTELMGRATEYRRAIAQGKPTNVAMMMAQNSAIDWNQRGNFGNTKGGHSLVTKLLNTIAYGFSQVVAFNQVVAGVKRHPVKSASLLTLITAVYAATQYLIYGWGDDDEKREMANQPVEMLPKFIYLPNSILFGPESSGLTKIRVPEFMAYMGAHFALGARSAYLAGLKGANTKPKDIAYFSWKTEEQLVAGTLPPTMYPNFLVTKVGQDGRTKYPRMGAFISSLIPTAAKTEVEVINGMKEYPTEMPIIPNYMSAWEAKNQYDKYTTASAKALASVFGWSPKMVDYYITQKTGRGVKMIIEVGEYALGKKDELDLYNPTQVNDRFFFSGELSNSFYDKANIAIKDYNSKKSALTLTEEDVPLAELYKAGMAVLSQTAKATMTKTNKQIDALQLYLDKMEGSPKLTQEERDRLKKGELTQAQKAAVFNVWAASYNDDIPALEKAIEALDALNNADPLFAKKYELQYYINASPEAIEKQ